MFLLLLNVFCGSSKFFMLLEIENTYHSSMIRRRRIKSRSRLDASCIKPSSLCCASGARPWWRSVIQPMWRARAFEFGVGAKAKEDKFPTPKAAIPKPSELKTFCVLYNYFSLIVYLFKSILKINTNRSSLFLLKILLHLPV